MFELRPIHDPKDGHVQLFDIFVDGRWLGSRRTEAQCEQQVAREYPLVRFAVRSRP